MRSGRMGWMPGLDVVIDGTGPRVLLNRTVFSAALQEVRPVTLHLVGARPGHRAGLAPILELAGDAGFEVCARAPEGARRYRAALGPGDLIYPEGWRLLIAALQAGEASMAAGAVLAADVTWRGAVPYVAGKRRREAALAWRPDRQPHGTIVDRVRPAAGPCCRIEPAVGESWGACG